MLTGAQATVKPGTYTQTGTAAYIDAQLLNVTFTLVGGRVQQRGHDHLQPERRLRRERDAAAVSVTDTDSDAAIVNTSPPQASADGAAVRPFARDGDLGHADDHATDRRRKLRVRQARSRQEGGRMSSFMASHPSNNGPFRGVSES